MFEVRAPSAHQKPWVVPLGGLVSGSGRKTDMATHYHDITKSFNSGFSKWHSQALVLLLYTEINQVLSLAVSCTGISFHALKVM